ncbi:MAG TPA: SOS response-associated peptidase [Burkholderiales bacterium]|nr:SOS response-associated peptidase [Burkholderiales bacterium]
MCGRYVSPDQAAIERAWRIGRINSNPFPRRFNVAPTMEVPVLLREDGVLALEGARWGLIPAWWKKDALPTHSINARLEEAAGKPLWRDPMRRSRCLLPAEGWYEWQALAGGKQPHHLRRADGRPFCFAGLIARWQGQWTCALLTKAAEGPAAEVHDRMPVVLPDEAMQAWLDPALPDATQFAREHALARDFVHYPVSKRVNNARNEGADLVEPLAA